MNTEKRTITVRDGMVTIRTENRRKRRNAKLAAAVILLACFALDAWLVMTGRTAGFDHAVDYYVYSLRNPVATAFYSVYTRIASGPVIVTWILILVLIPKTRYRIGLPLGIPAALVFCCYRVLKMLFARPRPDIALRLVTEHGYSFPSGHSMNGLMCYFLLVWLILRWLDEREAADRQRAKIVLPVICIALVLLVGFSRIYLGVHYVTDVLGGFLLGSALFLLITEFLIWFLDGGYQGRHNRQHGN